ncbi:MAG: glycoside hydrolase family 2 protein [Candidatus Lokiarchaeota archaeon]|nr:glycoside hydrolase family 2 protein [Candidatus Lokiarchaeota archaeon]
MKIIDLSGIWNLYLDDMKEKISFEVPGDIFYALIQAKKIPHPYFGTNELDVLWLNKKDWTCFRSFIVSNEMLQEKEIFLNINSLDTIGIIEINELEVCKTDNMFKRIRINIKDYLIEGKNIITIYFFSAENKALELSKDLNMPLPHTIHPTQSMHKNLIRKVQCHSGWDWGPCLMVSGIYGDIYIGGHSHARIEYIHTSQEYKQNNCEITIFIELFSPYERKEQIKILFGNEKKIFDSKLTKGINLIREKILIQNPKLWWPFGYGDQYLYHFEIQLLEDTYSKKIGLRKLRLINEKDQFGESFTIEINNKKIFCKGANWIPIDALPSLQTPKRYKDLLEDVIDANMNTIRVWGGGQYENELFYQLCDEKGILVWQDFMFACSTYPSTKEFLDNVEQEIIYQIKRLKDHPSIVIWCGDNENVGSISWFPITKKHREFYIENYLKLNHLIRDKVKELDPQRIWWPSSPCAGQDNFTDNWHSDKKGDMHYWSVWHEEKPFEAYYDVIPRFCSEFGYQSYPSLTTVKSFTNDTDLRLESKDMEHHQKNKRGNKIIFNSIRNYFKDPNSFKAILILSQIQQVYGIKIAIEFWRSQRNRCMGIMYWQLNDNWPVSSWSSIEYNGNWKLLHYAIKECYRPIHILAYSKDNKKIEIWAINDTTQKDHGCLNMKYMNYSGEIIYEKIIDIILDPESSKKVFEKKIEPIQFDKSNHFIFLSYKNNEIEIFNDFLLTIPKDSNLQHPKFILSKTKIDKKIIKIKLNSDKPAFFVTLSIDDIRGHFSENCFTIIPHQEKEIFFITKEELKIDIDKIKFDITHLRATYD